MTSTARITDYGYDATGTTTRSCAVPVPAYAGRITIIAFVAVYQEYPDNAPTVTGITYDGNSMGSPVHEMSYSPEALAMRLYCFGHEPAAGAGGDVTVTVTFSSSPTAATLYVYAVTNSMYLGHQAEDVSATYSDLTSNDFTKRCGLVVGCVFAYTYTDMTAYSGATLSHRVMQGSAVVSGIYFEYAGQAKTVLSGAQTGVDVHHLHIQVSLDTYREDVSEWM